MMLEDVAKIIGAILAKPNLAHDTPSGPLITQLREFAKQEQIEEISFACSLLRDAHFANYTYVLGQLPGVIINNYEPIRSNLYRLVGREQKRRIDEWGAVIKNALNDAARLTHEVNQIAAELARLPQPG
jgi:hypothetical protein